MLPGKLIDHGFYRISDRLAGQIAASTLTKRLPKHGNESLAVLPDGTHVWLARTAYRYRLNSPKRGWVWSIRDSGGWKLENGKAVLRANS
jgi:hypothetical protein